MAKALSNSGSTLKLLLVDDDENERILFEIALKKLGLGFRLKTAANVEEPIAYLKGEGVYADRTKYPVPDLVVLDLKMPAPDGFDFLRWRSSFSSCASLPVVVFSGSVNKEDVERSLRLGANRFFAKPSTLEQFIATVQEIVNYGLQCRRANSG